MQAIIILYLFRLCHGRCCQSKPHLTLQHDAVGGGRCRAKLDSGRCHKTFIDNFGRKTGTKAFFHCISYWDFQSQKAETNGAQEWDQQNCSLLIGYANYVTMTDSIYTDEQRLKNTKCISFFTSQPTNKNFYDLNTAWMKKNTFVF